MKLPLKLINLRLSLEMLERVDELANITHVTRTELIREAIVDRLRARPETTLPATDAFNVTALTKVQLKELAECIRWELRRRSVQGDRRR